MAKKKKSINIGIIIVAIIVVLALGFGIYKIIQRNNIQSAKSANDIVLNDKDSDDLKKEKISKKIELLNQEIEKIKAETEPEVQKLDKLYEEYVSAMNEQQTGTTETE